MDPALLKEREAFLRRAAALPTVQQRPNEQASTSKSKRPAEDDKDRERKTKANKKRKMTKNADGSLSAEKTANAADVRPTNLDYKSAKASMTASFGILAKVVDHMKRRHLNQTTWGLTIQEILEECQIFDLSKRNAAWLLEALPKNPKIGADADGTFVYCPPYKIGNKNQLRKVLESRDLEGTGGIYYSELVECVPNPDKIIQANGDRITVVPTKRDGKRNDKVLFFNPPESTPSIDDEFKQLWRSVAVDHLDEKKIDEYLQKHGIENMKDLAPKKGTGVAPKRKSRKKQGLVHNEHLKDQLEAMEMD